MEYQNKLDPNITVSADDCFHGTAVSSLIVDGPGINPDLEDGCGHFRVRHFGVATAGGFSSFAILRLIREVVAGNRDIKVWNLSLGSAMEIDPNFISPEAAELDRIQCEYDVIFVVAGTNRGKKNAGSVKIGAPADSLNSLVVNAVGADGQPASYTREGPVLSFFYKPDVSYYGGDGQSPIRVCGPLGMESVTGTSFAAPWITRKMAYFPGGDRDQGVDYTSTEMDIHFGRIMEKNKKAEIRPIDNNKQAEEGIQSIYEEEARKLYRKWDNVKHISEKLKENGRPRKAYPSGMWGLSIKTKERQAPKAGKGLRFGVVVTLKEMNGVNRIDEFIKLCMVKGWLVNRIDVQNQLDIYNMAEEEIEFE